MSDEFVRQTAQSIVDHQPLPVCPGSLTFDDAYRLQARVADLVSPAGFAGIKAGVTSPALQKNFGIDHALLGRLYASRRLENGATLPFVEGQLLECEIGLILDDQQRIDAVSLTVEFAFLKFARAEDATAPNLVAANVATDAFMTAPSKPYKSWTENPIVTMARDGEVINEAGILDSLGGPEDALDWILREAKGYEFPLSPGSLIMTGACGKVVPALPGDYGVTCAPLGELRFTIAG